MYATFATVLLYIASISHPSAHAVIGSRVAHAGGMPLVLTVNMLLIGALLMVGSVYMLRRSH